MGEAWRRRFSRVVLLLGAILLLAPAVAVAQSVNEFFGDSQIAVGATTTLTFAITNPDSPTPHAVSFDDTLPPGLQVTGTPTTDCLPPASASSSGPSDISFSDPAVTEPSCSVTATVQGVQAGSWDNPVTVTIDSTTSDITASINVDGPPTISAAFSPDNVRPNDSSQLTFTLGNPGANPDALTGINFTDTLPSGLTVPDGSTPACGGTLQTTSPDTITLTGAMIASGDTCQPTVTVTTAASDGQFTDTTGPVGSNEGGTNSTGASAALTSASPPALAAGFTATLLGLEGTTPLTFTITNPNRNLTLTGLAFTDTLPAGLVFTGPASGGNTCGGLVIASTGATTLGLSGVQLAPDTSCTVSQNVTATTTGVLRTDTGPVGSNEGGAGNSASAAITVVGAPRVTLSSPEGGDVYAFDQTVRASYSCADDPNGPGISSCAGDVPNGAPINTSKAGPHTLTVTATSRDGGMASSTVFYTVAPSNRFRLAARRVHRNGSVDFTITLPGPGRLGVLETILGSHLTFAQRQAVAGRAGTLHLTIRPNARGRQALRRRGHLQISVTLGYTPHGGTRRVAHFGLRITA